MDDIQDIYDNIQDVDDIEDVVNRQRKPKIYLEHMNPFDSYDENQFKKIYRFRKGTLRKLINELKPILETRADNKGRPISVDIQVLSTIRYLAKGNYQSEAADLHNFSQSTMSRITARVTRAIVSLIDRYIYFPRNERELSRIKEEFYNVAYMPNIVGAIDCTHIKIKNPGGAYPLLYMNRKGFYSLNVQVVCDANARIRNIVARWRGSAHDSRIWNDCNLKTQFQTGEINGIIIGDNGYPSSEFLLTPLLHPVTVQEQRYNDAHIRTRNVVERLFGQWKNKFRCFFNGMNMSLDTAKASIIALAILHNLAVEERVNAEEDYSDEEIPDEEEIVEANEVRQDNDQRNQFRQNYINMYF